MFSETTKVWLYGFFVIEQRWRFCGFVYPGMQHIFDGTVIFYTKQTCPKLSRLCMGMMFTDLKSVKKVALGPVRLGEVRQLAAIVIKINAIYRPLKGEHVMRRPFERFDIFTHTIAALNTDVGPNIAPEQHFQVGHIFKRLKNDIRFPTPISKATGTPDETRRMLFSIPKRQIVF